MKLLANRVDYLYSSASVVNQLFKSEQFASKKDSVTISRAVTRGLIYIAKSKQFDDELLMQVKKTLQSMQEDGSINQILEKYSLIPPKQLKGASSIK